MRKPIKTTAIVNAITVIGGFKFTETVCNSVRAIAKASRKSRADTEAMHLAYCNMTYATEQKEMETMFRVLWIQGDAETIISEEEAEMILKAGKGANAIDAAAVDRSYTGFRHHLVRKDCTVEVVSSSNHAPKAKATAKKITTQEQAMMTAFIAVCGSKARALELLSK